MLSRIAAGALVAGVTVSSALAGSTMSPQEARQFVAGKLFAGTYAIFSGIAVLVFAGVIFAPVVHRFLHRMHADEPERD